MSVSEYDASESWPFFTIAFFSLALFPLRELSDNWLVWSLSLLFAIPITIFQGISDGMPLFAPVATVLMTTGLFANIYRPIFGDALFFIVVGSFLAIITGV